MASRCQYCGESTMDHGLASVLATCPACPELKQSDRKDYPYEDPCSCGHGIHDHKAVHINTPDCNDWDSRECLFCECSVWRHPEEL